MPLTLPPRPSSPCTGIELLDYVAACDGEQVDAFKSLANGAARSSYALQWYADAQTFDIFVNIADDWEEMTRQQFYDFHGETERMWWFYD